MKRVRQKACLLCGAVSEVLYRVQSDTSGVWRLVCPTCRQSLAHQPFYRYGGTWKAVKRH